MDQELLEKLRGIKVLVLDFDGVLTDGYVYVDSMGNESVRCSHRDGMGVQLVKEAGVKVVVLTNQKSHYVVRRCDKMKIECIQTHGNKSERLGELLKKYQFQEICYVGDDVNDIDAMNKVGLPVAVADAEEAVRQEAAYITLRAGGQGAVREVCDMILKSKETGNE